MNQWVTSQSCKTQTQFKKKLLGKPQNNRIEKKKSWKVEALLSMQKILKNSQKQFMELIHGAISESYYFTQPNSF